MSEVIQSEKPRPFSAVLTKTYKVRPLSSNCPTIVKHNISPLIDNFQAFVDPADIKSTRDRPKTALSTGKKFKFDHPLLNPNSGVRSLLSPISAGTIRPSSAPYSSFVNFEFVQSIGKDKSKYEDKSGIKPMKKLRTEQFHSTLYKFKQQKEQIEQKITQLEEWQKEMNRGDVWNTPQAAIVDNILEISAKTHPHGVVNEYLRHEKEKEDEKKFRRKNLRPHSALGHNGRSVKTAKSVADFFRDYDKDDLIHDILASPKETNFSSNMASRKDIAEKINDYVDSMGNYRKLVDSSKDFLNSYRGNQSEKDLYQTFPVEEEAELVYHEEERVKNLTIETADERVYDIRDLQKIREISTTRGDGMYDSTLAKSTTKSTLTSPKGVVVIHSRPQTAKRNSTSSTPNLLTKDYLTLKNNFMGSLMSPKEGPLSLQGSRVIIRPFNELATSKSAKKLKAHLRKTKSKDMNLEQKLNELKKAEHLEQLNSSAPKLSRPRTAVPKVNKVESRPMSAKEIEVRTRLQSAKGPRENKSTIGTQTFEKPDASLNKIYIDGEYFNAYSYPMDPELYDRAKKNVLQSWISNARNGNLEERVEYTDGDSQSLS